MLMIMDKGLIGISGRIDSGTHGTHRTTGVLATPHGHESRRDCSDHGRYEMYCCGLPSSDQTGYKWEKQEVRPSPTDATWVPAKELRGDLRAGHPAG